MTWLASLANVHCPWGILDLLETLGNFFGLVTIRWLSSHSWCQPSRSAYVHSGLLTLSSVIVHFFFVMLLWSPVDRVSLIIQVVTVTHNQMLT